MAILKSFRNQLNKISKSTFDNHAMRLFRYQAGHNPVYKAYLEALDISAAEITSPEDIPFLPIEFFKYHEVKTGVWRTARTFASSGTTGMVRSRHLLDDEAFYHHHAATIFEHYFGPLAGKVILALLPSYLERSDSSLVSMVRYFIERSGRPESGFYLHNLDELAARLQQLAGSEQVVLFGVTFALLQLAEAYKLHLPQLTVIETGGMKGRGEEITREELIERLQGGLGTDRIYSEYGMTELLSQAYGRYGRFVAPPAMRILIRDINDPFAQLPAGRTGGINIIDLANVHSCAFVETKDLGRLQADGTFEVLGRFDNADLRGCNLLVG